MRTNPNDKANSTVVAKYIGDGNYQDEVVGGLSKREYFAAMAMQAILSYDNPQSYKTAAKGAVEAAEELIKALNEGGGDEIYNTEK